MELKKRILAAAIIGLIALVASTYLTVFRFGFTYSETFKIGVPLLIGVVSTVLLLTDKNFWKREIGEEQEKEEESPEKNY